MAEPNFSHLFMFIDWQSIVLHLICALYASSIKRLIRLNHMQTEQMGLLEKRKVFDGSSHSLFDNWRKYFLKIIFLVGTIGRTVTFTLQFLHEVLILSKKERIKMPLSRNPSFVTFHENKMHRKIWLNTLHSHFLHLWTVTSHKTPSRIDNLLK